MGCFKLTYCNQEEALEVNCNLQKKCVMAYRYGFQGRERDNEWKGDGNSMDFGARIYDPRIGKWLSIDPQFEKYPNSSTYSALGNNPMYYIDPEGETLQVSWASADYIDRYKAAVSLAFSGKVKVEVSENGVVTFHQLPDTKLTEAEISALNFLRTVETSKLIVEQKLVGAKEHGGTLGRFTINEPSYLNVDVLIKMGSDPNTLSALTGLIHEVAENYKKSEIQLNQLVEYNYTEFFFKSHDYASEVDAPTTNLVLGHNEYVVSKSDNKYLTVVITYPEASLDGEDGVYNQTIKVYTPSNKVVKVDHDFQVKK